MIDNDFVADVATDLACVPTHSGHGAMPAGPTTSPSPGMHTWQFKLPMQTGDLFEYDPTSARRLGEHGLGVRIELVAFDTVRDGGHEQCVVSAANGTGCAHQEGWWRLGLNFSGNVNGC